MPISCSCAISSSVLIGSFFIPTVSTSGWPLTRHGQNGASVPVLSSTSLSSLPPPAAHAHLLQLRHQLLGAHRLLLHPDRLDLGVALDEARPEWRVRAGLEQHQLELLAAARLA